MSRMIYPYAVGLMAFGLAVSATRADPLESPRDLSPRQGVVLLRNGQVISGKISRAGESFLISLPVGEIRLKASDVEGVFDNLDQGYGDKRSHLTAGSAAEHLELAEWCLRQKLLGYAAKELSEALVIDPEHPRIALIERRLELARRQSAERQGSPATSASPIPSNADLDRLVRGMPAGTVESFTTTIQPLLLNSCSTSACHGPRSKADFKMLRTASGQTPSRRMTQRNLHAVWQLIDIDDPSASPLLTTPIDRHGTAKAAIFTSREAAQYRQLANWVKNVSRRRSSVQPESVRPVPPLLQQIPSTPKASTRQPPASAREGASGAPPEMEAGMPAGDELDDSDLDDSDLDRLPFDEAELVTGDKPAAQAEAPYAPVDEFDPEIFNRRYFPVR